MLFPIQRFALTLLILWFVKSSFGEDVLLEDSCTPVPDLFIENRTRELECCDTLLETLYTRWTTQEVYLTRTLDTLKSWNCPQFQQACSDRYLAFTDFTALVYDRFCNESDLMTKCGDVVAGIVTSSGISDNSTLSNWTQLARKLNSSQLTSEQLDDKCIQVALYDAAEGGWRGYHETIVFVVPFCNSVWCGYDYNSIETLDIRSSKCYPTSCKANIFILVACFIVLSVTILAFNFTVILVYSTERKSRHSQGLFRLALGVADFMVGLIVFPSAAYVLITLYQHPLNLQSPFNVTGANSLLDENRTVTVEMLKSRPSIFRELFPGPFLDAIGFFNTLSITVSTYVLTVSGVDRLMAVSRPVQYRQHVAKRFATTSCLVCFGLGAFVSILPTFVDNLFYIVTSSALVTLTGRLSLILYSAAFFVPLVATWGIAIGMFIQGRASFKRRANMSTVRHQQIRQQRRLNRILGLMVAAFSVSVAPTVLVLIILLFIPGTNPAKLETYNPLFNNIANSLENTATIILLSNSLWNCLIYSVRTKNFRKMVKQKYKDIWRVVSPIRLFRRAFRCCIKRSLQRRKSSKTFSDSSKTHSSNLHTGSVFNMMSKSNHSKSNGSSPKKNKQGRSSSTGQESRPRPNSASTSSKL